MVEKYAYVLVGQRNTVLYTALMSHEHERIRPVALAARMQNSAGHACERHDCQVRERQSTSLVRTPRRSSLGTRHDRFNYSRRH